MPRLPALLALAVALTLVGAPTAPTGPASAADAVPPTVPVIGWGACDGAGPSPRIQCATVPVPLDYDDPTGPTVPLDVVRVRASDPAARIGSLFVNPGGPGGSARSFALDFGSLVPSVVGQRFDVIGVDPRGVGPSSYAVCRNPDRRPPMLRAAFPTTARQVRTRLAGDRWERTACREGGRPILEHMTTADTARDMDLVRQAVGDAQLTYYGVSYGTQLGTTYAAMFPGNVRAMVLDGVLDPVQWSTGRPGDTGRPFSTRLGSDDGAWEALTAAFAACDRVGRHRCAISGHARAVWDSLARRLRRQPFQGIGFSELVSGTLGALYDARGVRGLMGDLARLHAAVFRGAPAPRARVWRSRPTAPGQPGAPGPYAPTAATRTSAYGAVADAFAGVACADTDNPADPHAWAVAARRADRTSHGFGSAWTWASSVCAGWPAATRADRFTGPYDVTPSAPVLVVGNTHDPATPISGARAVHALLGGSRLLVLDGWGHGAIGTGACVSRAYAAYLVDLKVPAAGAVCTPDRPLFPRR